MSYLKNAPSKGVTPQSKKLPGQKRNRAGGGAWQVDPMTRLRRFLILGAEGGTYYVSEHKLVKTNITVLGKVDPYEAIDDIVAVSEDGRAAKNDPAIFCLAYFAGYGDSKNLTSHDIDVRQSALAKLDRVVRTGYHMFQFLSFIEDQRGWGRSLRRAVGRWFADRPAEALAYQMAKYRQREGWSQIDALRLAHPAARVSSGNPTLPISREQAAVFNWTKLYMHPRNPRRKKKDTAELPRVIQGLVRAQKSDSPAKTARLVREYNLTHEMILPEHKNDQGVWESLLYGNSGHVSMPLGALIRQLPTLTNAGIIKPMGHHTGEIIKALTNDEWLKAARIHPLQALIAQFTYQSGQSVRGDNTWQPVREIASALNDVFYKCFANVEPTGKKHLLGLDVSGSMKTHIINGVPNMSARIASAAMAMVTAHSGDPFVTVAFSAKNARYGYAMLYEDTAIRPMNIGPDMRLNDVLAQVDALPYGATDCALPMVYALEHELEVDCFVIYTDNESWVGPIHASQALQQYREHSGLDARMVVCAMTADKYSVADPDDAGQMDVVGFDTNTPLIISDFAKGEL